MEVIPPVDVSDVFSQQNILQSKFYLSSAGLATDKFCKRRLLFVESLKVSSATHATEMREKENAAQVVGVKCRKGKYEKYSYAVKNASRVANTDPRA